MSVYFGDLKTTALVKQSVVPAAAKVASANGVGCDMLLGDGNNFVAILNMGVYDVATDESYQIKITESDDNTTFVPLATPLAFTSKAGTVNDGLAYVEVITGMRSKRYLRAEIVVGGTTPSIFPVVTFIEKLKISGTGGGYQA